MEPEPSDLMRAFEDLDPEAQALLRVIFDFQEQREMSFRELAASLSAIWAMFQEQAQIMRSKHG